MHISTPRKYRGRQSRSIIGCRRIVLWVVALVLIGFGVFLYHNRSYFQPIVNDVVMELVENAEVSVATLQAPTAIPSATPDTNKLITGHNFWEGGSVNEAVDAYQEVASLTPNDPLIYERIAVGLIIAGNEQDALQYAEQAVNADPFSSDAWAVYAWALDWNSRPTEAIVNALHALELDPNNYRAQAFLGEAYFSAGQTQRALDTLQEVIDNDPDNVEAYRARGLVKWLGLFDLPAALDDFRIAYDIASRNNPTFMTFMAINISDIEYSQGSYQEAIDILRDVIEINPENSQALYRLGAIYNGGLGDPNQAISYLTRCIDYSPKNVDCYYLLGRAQERIEEYTSAANSFAKAIDLGSQNPRHFYWAGWLQINVGDCERAMEYLQPGLELARAEDNQDIVDAISTVIPNCSSQQSEDAPFADTET